MRHENGDDACSSFLLACNLEWGNGRHHSQALLANYNICHFDITIAPNIGS